MIAVLYKLFKRLTAGVWKLNAVVIDLFNVKPCSLPQKPKHTCLLVRKSEKNVKEPGLDSEVQPRSSFLSDEGRKAEAEAKPTHFRVVLIFPAFSIPLTN